MRCTISRSVGTAFYTFILVLVSVGPAHAQFRASVQGSVVDAQGAAVVGTSIILINKETNRTQQSSSGDEGFYRFDNLSPGKYMLVAEHKGFKKKVLADIEVKAEEVQGINIQLEAGEIIETVTISAELSEQLKTENANIARSISEQEILRLPQYGRDPYELVRLAPGVFGLGARDPCCRSVGFPNSVGPGSNNSIFQPNNQVPVSANGQRPTANNYEVDGVSVNSQVWGGAAVVTPNQESVKEVRVASAQYSAESGRATGALIQVVSRNGTNDFHGSAFLKYQDPALNAFNKWGGPFGGQPQRVERRFCQWGGSIGGPVYLPRFSEGGQTYWSGKNRLFFFFSYETLRTQTNNFDNLWIETPEFRQLLLSQRAGSLAAQITNIRGMDHRILSVRSIDCASAGMLNPATCKAIPGGLDIGGPVGTIGQRTSNSVGGGLDNVPDIRFAQILFPTSTKSQQISTRIDYQVTSRDLVVFSIYNTPNDTRTALDGRPIQDFLVARRNIVGALLWSRTLSPTATNEIRFNVTRVHRDDIKSNPKVPFGIPLAIASIPLFPFRITWGHGDVEVLDQTSYNLRDIFSKVMGNHGLRLGGEYGHEQNNDVVAGLARPIYGFNNLWNFANDAPDQEVGNFDPRSGIPTDAKKYIRANTYSFFLQDDWKVQQNLTLNLGLRWEYMASPKEKNGNLSNLTLGSGENALTDAVFKIGGNLYEPDWNNFGPQIGFAWSPQKVFGVNTNNKAVLRGGFGIGFNRIPQSLTLNGRLNPPLVGHFALFGNQVLYTLGSNLNSFYGWPSNPNTIMRIDPKTQMPLTGLRSIAFATLQHVPNPYSYRYSLEAEYELAPNWIGSLGYQGSTGHKLPRIVDYSLFVPPNLNLGALNLLQSDVDSNFNAMLAQLSHRFAKGFDFHMQYRWSKSLDTCSYDDSCEQTYPFDQKTERGPSDYDVRHYFAASGLWDLPIFKDRGDFVGKVFGGWQFSGIVTASSGFPWTPVYNACVNLIRRGFLCPLRPIAYAGGLKQDTSNEAFQQPGGTFGISNASEFFEPPPVGNVAVPPQPGIGRNVFRGPRYFSADVSLVKRIGLPRFARFSESSGLDLRANFFNVFNTLNLAPFQFGSPSTFIDTPFFGRATHGLAGRVIELQARFFF